MEAARIEAADLEQKAIQEQQNPPPKRRGRPPQQKNIAAAAAAAEAKGAKEAPQNVRQSGRGQEAAGVCVKFYMQVLPAPDVHRVSRLHHNNQCCALYG